MLFSWTGTRPPLVKDGSFFYVTLQLGHWNLQRIEHSLTPRINFVYVENIVTVFLGLLKLKLKFRHEYFPILHVNEQTAGG